MSIFFRSRLHSLREVDGLPNGESLFARDKRRNYFLLFQMLDDLPYGGRYGEILAFDVQEKCWVCVFSVFTTPPETLPNMVNVNIVTGHHWIFGDQRLVQTIEGDLHECEEWRLPNFDHDERQFLLLLHQEKFISRPLSFDMNGELDFDNLPPEFSAPPKRPIFAKVKLLFADRTSVVNEVLYLTGNLKEDLYDALREKYDDLEDLTVLRIHRFDAISSPSAP